MKTKKPGLMALFAAILMLISSCSKSPVEQSNPHPERKSSTHFAFWNGYNFFSATGDHYSNVFQKYPSSDNAEQSLAELAYYTAWGIQKIISTYSSGSILIHDIAQEIDATNNLLFAEYFFQKYPQYLNSLNTVLLNEYGLNYSALLSAVNRKGTDYSITLSFPLHAAPIDDPIGNPVVAFVAELPQPDSTTLVRVDEDLGPDYYDDDDFIPCFYPLSSEELPDFAEMMVGFDDYYEDPKNLIQQTANWIILVNYNASQSGSQGLLEKKGPKNYQASNVSGNNLPIRSPGCEAGTSLQLQNLVIKQRFQRFGSSRIRVMPNVQGPGYIWFTYDQELILRGSKIKIAKLKKSEIPNNFRANPLNLEGIDYSLGPKNPILGAKPNGFSFFYTLYEHDWYGPKWESAVYNASLGNTHITPFYAKFDDEFYGHYYVEEFDWCYPSLVNFDQPNRSESDLYAGK